MNQLFIDTNKRYIISGQQVILEILTVKSYNEEEILCHVRFFDLGGDYLKIQTNYVIDLKDTKHWIKL